MIYAIACACIALTWGVWQIIEWWAPSRIDTAAIFSVILIYAVALGHAVRGALTRPLGQWPSYLRPNILFLVMYGLIFFLPYVQAHGDLTLLEDNRFIDNLYLQHAPAAYLLAGLLLVPLIVGQQVGRNYRLPEKPVGNSAENLAEAVAFSHISTLLLTATILGFEMSGAADFMTGAYTGLGAGNSTGDGLYFLVTMFAMCCVAVAIIRWQSGIPPDALSFFGVIVATYWAIKLLASGDRNSFLLIATVAFAGYSTFIKKVPVWLILCAVMAGWVVYGVVEVTRSTGARTISEFLSAMFEARPPEESISDSSVSLTTATLRASLDISPNLNAIYNGWFKLVGFLGVIPYSRQLLPVPDDGFYTSAQAITKQILGSDPTWSLGSNIISDVVLDFGLIGALVTFFMLGWLLERIVVWGRTGDLTGTINYMLSAALFFQIPRYSLDFPVRTLLWCALLVLLAKRFSKYYR